MKKLRCALVRSHAYVRANHGVASGVNAGPRSGRNTCQNRDTVSSAFLCFGSLDFLAVNISLDLPP